MWKFIRHPIRTIREALEAFLSDGPANKEK